MKPRNRRNKLTDISQYPEYHNNVVGGCSTVYKSQFVAEIMSGVQVAAVVQQPIGMSALTWFALKTQCFGGTCG